MVTMNMIVTARERLRKIVSSDKEISGYFQPNTIFASIAVTFMLMKVTVIGYVLMEDIVLVITNVYCEIFAMKFLAGNSSLSYRRGIDRIS